MPEMDGLETVRELRKIDSLVPIIMFSTLTERGASVTLEALALGATDYITKPSNLDGAATFDAVIHELLPKVRALCHLPGAQGLTVPLLKAIPVVAPPPMPRRLVGPAKIVVIGVSTWRPRCFSATPSHAPGPTPRSVTHRTAHAPHLHDDARGTPIFQIFVAAA